MKLFIVLCLSLVLCLCYGGPSRREPPAAQRHLAGEKSQRGRKLSGEPLVSKRSIGTIRAPPRAPDNATKYSTWFFCISLLGTFLVFIGVLLMLETLNDFAKEQGAMKENELGTSLLNGGGPKNVSFKNRSGRESSLISQRPTEERVSQRTGPPPRDVLMELNTSTCPCFWRLLASCTK